MTKTLTESIVPSDRPLFHRRIEFVPAKKPFTGFSYGGGGFRLETLNPTSLVPQRGGGSNQGALAAKKPEFWDVDLDSELSPGITFTRIGAGLENLGNTSFLNSVLQCLTYTEPLAAYLQSGKHQNSCRTAGFCALCALQKHVCRALLSTGRSLSPNDLVSNLRCISRNFLNARQEDSHEYMINLLESMHRCCLPAGIPSESPSAYEKSLVHKIFGGCFHSQVECTQCSACSNKFDPFLDLSLEIMKAESLSKALMHFTAKEYLDGGEQRYQCQTCKQKVNALKQLTIHKAPYVLTIHLKRFGTHQPGKKIDKNVQFGSSLDLKPFVTGSYDGDLRYTLCSVLVHAGSSIHSGHYSSFVRTSAGMWFSLDDHQVHQVSEKKVLEQKAYILFYVRDRSNFAPKKPVEVVPKETGHKVNDRNKDRSVNTDLIGMVAMAPNCCLPEKVVTKKEEHYEDVTGKFEPLRSLGRLNRVNSRIDGLAKESALSDGGQPTEVVESVEFSGLGTTQLPLDQEILNYKLQRRKKMLSKCQVTSMRLGPRILFGASLIPWKKKHKKIKQCDDNISNCPQQQLLGREFSPTDLGPSSYERTKSLSIGGRKGLKSDSCKNTNSAVAKDVKDYIDDSADWISRDKFGQNGATLQPQRSCSSPLAGNQQNNFRANCSTENRSDSEQDGSTSMLTRGLQETVVEPWDGIKLPSSQNTESSVMKSASIGYVADEWDEEYDKGKRKKLRSSNIVFDGQNPFQEIATKKAKLKKAKLGQSSSRN